MMKKWISILAGLLVLQLVLALGLNLSEEDYGAFEPQERLLAFDAKRVDGLRIQDAKQGVLLRMQEGTWVLPESGDFPADQGSVQQLLNKLAALKKGLPVATSGGAAKRFRVTQQAFERKLTLLAQDEFLAELYLGDSPGFRKVHVRPAGEDVVYSVAFDTWEAGARAEDWIDKTVLKLDPAAVTRLAMPGFTLRRDGDKLVLAHPGDGETLKEEEAKGLLRRLADLTIEGLLGTEAKPEYRQDQPDLELRMDRKEGGELTYRFSKPEGASYYVLWRSDRAHYFKVPDYLVNPIKETTREKLVQAQGVAEGGTAVGTDGGGGDRPEGGDQPVVKPAEPAEDPQASQPQ
jgi:hypothetical protein